ncbi:sporulation integral membrane protein YlbJ [Fodinisporobacter ferrooxydans]|uniref:Sporulation integral membrane protein YlbJ n=1 Tax=Fodinisporobacter ferrooxydans TaxID=2901836 RepID=A0ABY4CPB7_9BACL|nr:sporulation integral membrane protein YlbJ [Alicyclobacillaceae bacterium MYW30-H2]
MTGKARRSMTIFLAVVVVFLTISLVLYPEQAFQAGTDGLKVFWDAVFPSLLPFFILSEVMLGLGVVNALGVILEPLMRPLFSVPGAGAFALSMGLAAGYPMDAVITAKFRRNKLCSRIEGERLLAFTNTADPLFMFGSVAVGMFKSPSLGMLLAIAHYISAFLVGFSFKFYGRRTERKEREEESFTRETRTDKKGRMFSRAILELIKAREEDGRTLGKLLGDAVNDSIKTLFMICGFIIFFAVLIRVLTEVGFTSLLSYPLHSLFALLGIDPHLIGPTLSGIFEIDIGASQASQVAAPMVQKFLIVSAIIAWSGLSVHGQVASVLTGTDIRMFPYIMARMFHAVLAAILTVVFYNLGFGNELAHTFFLPTLWSGVTPTSAHWLVSWTALKNWADLLGITIGLSLLVYVGSRFRRRAPSSR